MAIADAVHVGAAVHPPLPAPSPIPIGGSPCISAPPARCEDRFECSDARTTINALEREVSRLRRGLIRRDLHEAMLHHSDDGNANGSRSESMGACDRPGDVSARNRTRPIYAPPPIGEIPVHHPGLVIHEPSRVIANHPHVTNLATLLDVMA